MASVESARQAAPRAHMVRLKQGGPDGMVWSPGRVTTMEVRHTEQSLTV